MAAMKVEPMVLILVARSVVTTDETWVAWMASLMVAMLVVKMVSGMVVKMV